MQNSNIIKRISAVFIGISVAFSQIEFDVSWTPYVTYYLSMVDINTGESSMPIFLAELNRESDAPDTVKVDILFEIIIDSEALGVNNEILVKLETSEPIDLVAPIHLSNMDLNITTDEIFDDYGNSVDLKLDITEQMDLNNAEEMMSAIVQTGQLPNGIYTFRVSATSSNGQQIIREDVLNIYNPDVLQLISPGGVLADTSLNQVYSSYPVLQWESDICNYIDPITGQSGCEYFIRVAEFKPEEHSSIDQAIESVTRLPLDQSLGFEPAGFGVTLFQYPTDAGDLEPGKVYVWQVRKDIMTTSGMEELLSDVFSFKVVDFSSLSSTDNSNIEDLSPSGRILRSLIGDELAEQIFGPEGEAFGMATNGNITLNGESVDVPFIQSLFSRGIPENGNENFRPMEILSVEISE